MDNEFVYFIGRKNWYGSKEDQHRYVSNYYAEELVDKRDEKLLFVELGVRDGADLVMFADWLHKSKVVGIDKNAMTGCPKGCNPRICGCGGYDVKFEELNNIEFKKAEAYSTETVNKFEDESIDYLIDDASHILEDQIKCLNLYYPKMKKGGKLIIEDVGFLPPHGSQTDGDNAIKSIRESSKDLYDFKLFDLRDQTRYGFSILIELQKR